VKVTCACGVQVERYQLASHKERECSHRLIKCSYCNLQKKAIELEKHRAYCGSRTEMCSRCHTRVMLKGNLLLGTQTHKFSLLDETIMHIFCKDLEQHHASNCTYPRVTNYSNNNNNRNTNTNTNTNNRPPQQSFLSGILKFLGFS
jgi:hypothetical protein